MKILHPKYNTYLSLNELDKFNTGLYYKILTEDDISKLTHYQKKFHDFQVKNQYEVEVKNESVYENLPFSLNSRPWLERQKDVKVIMSTINKRSGLNILEIGSYNCWLTNYLAKQGHHVINVDIFEHKHYGLGAKQFYSSNFISLQMYSEQFYRIQSKFDIIIFNRNWPYVKVDVSLIQKLKKMLNRNGTIFLTGLNFYKLAKQIKSSMEATKTSFEANYGLPFFYNDSKGYLDFVDYDFLLSNNFKFMPYNKIDYIKNLLNKKKIYGYATFKCTI